MQAKVTRPKIAQLNQMTLSGKTFILKGRNTSRKRKIKMAKALEIRRLYRRELSCGNGCLRNFMISDCFAISCQPLAFDAVG